MNRQLSGEAFIDGTGLENGRGSDPNLLVKAFRLKYNAAVTIVIIFITELVQFATQM